MIVYTEGDTRLLAAIEPLWQKLNCHHERVSPFFAHTFAGRTFSARTAAFFHDDIVHVRVDLATDSETGAHVGYCVSTIDRHNGGEIDSIYVEETYRGSGIAHELMERSLAWLRTHAADPIQVSVVYGNERAFNFYAKYGFYPRHTVLVAKTEGEPT